MVQGGFFMRHMKNIELSNEIMSQRGHLLFSDKQGSSDLSAETKIKEFSAQPIIDFYFDKLLAMLNKQGVEVIFVGGPINMTSYSRLPPDLSPRFTKYVKAYSSKYPRFRTQGDLLPHMQDDFFSDSSHLNRRGAECYTKSYAEILN
jgi:hypothetical protein